MRLRDASSIDRANYLGLKGDEAMEGLRVQGVFGLIVLALDIWAIIHVVQSGASMAKKVIWVIVILLLPLVGFLLWLVLGPRKGTAG